MHTGLKRILKSGAGSLSPLLRLLWSVAWVGRKLLLAAAVVASGVVFLLSLTLAFQELGFFSFVLGCALSLRVLEHGLTRRLEDTGVVEILKGRV